jgi:hypothetical protein
LPLFKALQLLNHRGIPARLVQRYTALDVSGAKVGIKIQILNVFPNLNLLKGSNLMGLEDYNQEEFISRFKKTVSNGNLGKNH